MTHPPLAALLVAAVLVAGCGPDDEPDPRVGVPDLCDGGLAPIDGECVLLENAMEVLLFRTTTGPYVSTCTTRITGEDPGIAPAVVAEAGGCRVIDTDKYGPANFEAAARESGVSLQRGDDLVLIDEAELFDSCIERRTLPLNFMDFDGSVAASFAGSTTIPAFDASIDITADPGFVRSAVVDGSPITFSWTNVAADSALIVVAEPPLQIVCNPNPAAGQFSVPANLVNMLPESDPPGLEPLTSIRMRNRTILPYPEQDAVVTLTADTYQSSF